MNLRELHALLTRNLERHGDEEVMIRRRDPSVGGCAKTGLQSAYSGIDWDHGKFLIEPADPLYLHNDAEQIAKLRQQIDGLVWENMNLKRAARKPKGGAA